MSHWICSKANMLLSSHWQRAEKKSYHGFEHCTRWHGNQIQVPLSVNSWIKFEVNRTGRTKIFSPPETISGNFSENSFKALLWFTRKDRVENKSSPYYRETVTTKMVHCHQTPMTAAVSCLRSSSEVTRAMPSFGCDLRHWMIWQQHWWFWEFSTA